MATATSVEVNEQSFTSKAARRRPTWRRRWNPYCWIARTQLRHRRSSDEHDPGPDDDAELAQLRALALALICTRSPMRSRTRRQSGAADDGKRQRRSARGAR
ncbi:hypothetical protein BRADI_2g05211v3 [Brachypodium distachyon]|uniref:Uncharacterized protein n=1 Tax=Brachypodium distachyon TaxID=15368 RepID=A0A2K2D731_BRADI|nr:hypothetical protein BRADI_2g05211v3 [Brachypodium distachyon]